MKRVSEHLPVTTGNHWGRGCANCKYGMVGAPELSGACEVYLERLVQAIDGELTFCTCQAGTRYRAFLGNRFQFLKREVKADGRMAQFVANNSHPDIEAARKAMDSSYGMAKLPNIHWVDSEPTPAEEVVPA
jgi:hypothetical protein